MEMIGKKSPKGTRDKVIKTLKKWSGKLIEPKYTQNISANSLKNKINDIIYFPQNRVSILKRLIYSKILCNLRVT